jgi:hypothetical protein
VFLSPSVAQMAEMYDNEPLIWWDNLKYQIKRYSKLFSSNLAKEKRKDFFYIQNKIQRLCDAQARGINLFYSFCIYFIGQYSII